MKNWEATLVGPQTSLERAIAAMDRSALRIAIIVDEERRLLGTLTDGDVRRTLLRHQSIDVPVSEVMCKTPKVAQRAWGRERVLALMESSNLLQLPVVDDENRVVGLETVHDLLGQRLLNNPVFLMAGGFGTRLHPLTKDCPKPMLEVGGKPILERILQNLVDVGFQRFFISTHYLPEMVRAYFGDGSRWGVNIQYTHEPQPLGTGGALGLLPHEEINEPMLMMNGDILTTLDYRGLLDFHVAHPSVATICVREFQYQVPYGVIESAGHLIRKMTEKPTQKFFINAGVYMLSPDLVRSVQPGTKVDMPTLLEREIANQKDVTMFPVHEYWLDIGRMDDFNRAQIDLQKLI